MPRQPAIKFVLGCCAALAVLALLVNFMSWFMQPDRERELQDYTPEQIEAAKKLRDISLDPDNPPVVNQMVDYSEGEDAAWWPKGESPLLTDLVREGKLPPVAERVGPEPCVMRGCEGIGRYGGTYMRIAVSDGDVNTVTNRMAYPNLVRWSPYGYPIVPHAAKRFEVNEDNTEFTFWLRKGMKWSDGEPFTADDIMFWWEEFCLDEEIMNKVPEIMTVRGKQGDIEKLGPHTIKIIFPEPHGVFLEKLCTSLGGSMMNFPKHYLEKYHPRLGDLDLIEERRAALSLATAKGAFADAYNLRNPECPRLWPWVYRTYKASPPQSFVRNPYYWAVDVEGNQLPYPDRILFEVKNPKLMVASVAQGEVSMQMRNISYRDYTLLMSQREKYDYQVRHWYDGGRGKFIMNPNLNRRVDPARPETQLKKDLLNDKRFRQAVSLAINRPAIIKAEFDGQTEAANDAPSPSSFFHDPAYYKAFTDYDPDQANQLLDELGLTERDYEGMRTFANGMRMTFYHTFEVSTSPDVAQTVKDDLARVGIRLMLRNLATSMYFNEMHALDYDFISIGTYAGDFPILDPGSFCPHRYSTARYAIGFARWYERGGMRGEEMPENSRGIIEPPIDHPLRKALEIWERSTMERDPVKQKEAFQGAYDIATENLWRITVCSSPPVLAVVRNGFRNVPKKGRASWNMLTPGNFGFETFYFDETYPEEDSPGAIEQMKKAILKVTVNPNLEGTTSVLEAEAAAGTPEQSFAQKAGAVVTAIIKWMIIVIVVLGLILISARHPYIGKRILIMVPTLLIISIISFAVIQLPPGDYITTLMIQLSESGGEQVAQERMDELTEMFWLEEPVYVQYMNWLGLRWFWTFESKHTGLLQGNMGRSMETSRQVNQIVGDRVLLTFLISLGTILFTWAIAIPIGIYSAVRQYSVADYILTFIGFIGMCVPSFLLALLLMYFSSEYLGNPISGLFSSQYGAQPEWNWPKIWDLLKHIWVPIVVLGVTGTAGMIRVMRANLLDELKKPYVVTARAKGVRPLKLLFKYPVRIALNPFISGIGGLFPVLVSGGAIVAMVLSLPTVGPLMLDALMKEDMYLAGSMLMMLSLLAVMGTLVSDLLLLVVDPRIRFQGGSR